MEELVGFEVEEVFDFRLLVDYFVIILFVVVDVDVIVFEGCRDL